MSHTPGPWEYDGENYIWTLRSNPKMIAEIRGSGWKAPRDANAILMAAAPEMYSALVETQNLLSAYNSPEWMGILDRVKKAIANAKKPI